MSIDPEKRKELKINKSLYGISRKRLKKERELKFIIRPR